MHLFFAALLALTQQWLVVSDLHVNPFDTSNEPANYQQDTNWVLFDAAVRQMHQTAPDASVVIIPGDFLAHEFAAKVHAAGAKRSVSRAALSVMQRVERRFSAAFPHARFLIALGNNDDPCGDYRTAPDTPYLRHVAQLWAPLVNRNGTVPAFVRDFSHDGSYAVQLSNRLRAIVIDDVPWSFVFRGCEPRAGAMPQMEMHWLTRELQTMPQGQRAVVVMHIPPGVDAASTLLAQRFLVVPFLRGDVTASLTSIMGASKGRVSAIIAGHTHRSDFRLLAGVPVLIAPSISPIYSNSPAFVTLQVDSGGTLHDYRIYSYDLFAGAWSRAFDFDEAYRVDGFTAGSLTTAHARIPDDLSVRMRWESGLTAASPAYRVRADWRAYWCAQTELRGGYAACAGDQRRVIVLRIVIALVALALVLAAVFVTMRLARQRRRA